jgi:hypothetical protein
VEFVSPASLTADEAGILQDLEVLRHGLSRRGEAVSADQAAADLKQRLLVPFGQFVEDDPAGLVGQCFVYVTHVSTIGKRMLACQRVVGGMSRAVESARSSPALLRTSEPLDFLIIRGQQVARTVKHDWGRNRFGPPWVARSVLIFGGLALLLVGILPLQHTLNGSAELAELRDGRGVVVEGVITDVSTEPSSSPRGFSWERADEYCPRYQFETPEGLRYYFEPPACSRDASDVPIGGTAEIIYDPRDTDIAYLNSERASSPLPMLAVSAVGILLGLAILAWQIVPWVRGGAAVRTVRGRRR